MKTVAVTVDESRCKACELCITFCPEDVLALALERFNALGYTPVVAVRPERCTGCAHCARMCPEAAITITVTQRATAAAR